MDVIENMDGGAVRFMEQKGSVVPGSCLKIHL